MSKIYSNHPGENDELSDRMEAALGEHVKAEEQRLARPDSDLTGEAFGRYNLTYAYGIRLSLSQRIKLCVALLEPDCSRLMPTLSQVVALLKSIL